MPAPQLTELKNLLGNRPVSLFETRSPQRGLSIRKRQQQKYEPRLPEFNSYYQEIEWRLREISVNLNSPTRNNTVGWEAIARHWCRVAILAGYEIDHHYLKRKEDPTPLYLCSAVLKIWDNCLEQLFLDYATFLHPELQPKAKLNRYVFFDSYGKQSEIKAENVCDFAMQMFKTNLTNDEKKRCLSMLKTMKVFQHSLSGLSIRLIGSQILISQQKNDRLFEIIAVEQARTEKAEAC